MDVAADLALQAILGRSGDFVGGIDNEALDFSQLEDFINSEGSQANNNYFNESLNTAPTSGKLLNVIVENKRNATNGGTVVAVGGHPLPDSPPDSSSEHPYSPQEGCDQGLNPSDQIYTTLGQAIYKQPQSTLISSMLGDNLIIGSHIVVSEPNQDQSTIDSNNLIQGNGQNGGEPPGTLLQERLLLQDNHTDGYGHNHEVVIAAAAAAAAAGRQPLYKNDDYEKNHLIHLGYGNHGGIEVAINRNDGMVDGLVDGIPTVYTNLQNVSTATPPSANPVGPTTTTTTGGSGGGGGNSGTGTGKKRKLSQETNGSGSVTTGGGAGGNNSAIVKSEPDHHCTTSQLSPPGGPLSTSMDEEYQSEACLSESQYQCIRFSAFQQSQWHALCDQNLTELHTPHYRVDADKGFNFSNADDAFVCQKKNHFQITCHVQLLGDAQFVKTPDGFQKISSFHLHFYGVKHDCPTQTIRVEQSQSDRSKKPFHPVLVELVNSQVTKVTVGRLHFSETTSNNMRKKGKPNPEQRYFQLVVGLHAHTTNGNFPVISHASQKIIVRASNPGQFESDVELCWQKGQTQDSIFHNGKVGVNTDRPDESLVVHGNIKVTGHIIQPSDIRAKKNIVECDPAEQLRNVQKLRVVRYDYEPSFASQLSQDTQHSDTGVIAQEVAKILPEAVRPAGDLILENGQSIDNFLVVNKERIFMENIGAVKELCRVTDNLETRIDQLERINRRLNKLKRGDSLKSNNSTVSSSKHSYTKCSRHHKCNHDDELCSNKFIQIIIVVLVLIMAFCLAAITTLYLMETSRHNQFVQTNLQATHRNALPTKRTVKNNKNYQTHHTIQPHMTPNPFRDKDIGSITIDSSLIRRPSFIIGRPSECLSVDQDLENSNLCQIYCCASVTTPLVAPPPELIVGAAGSGASTTVFTDKANADQTNKTQFLNTDKVNKIARPFHSNDIDKQTRQKRDALDLSDDANSFDATDDQMFAIVIQGRNFNTTLTHKYLISDSGPFNFSYAVPISKYMPDDFINLIFRSTQAKIKEIEHCSSDYKQHECTIGGGGIYYDDKTQIRHRVNENSSSQLLSTQSVIFEVDMADFQSKKMTYRASLNQSLNTCKSSTTRAGVEFIEYNFHFYRRCDE